MTLLPKSTMDGDGQWIVVPYLLTRTPAGLSDARVTPALLVALAGITAQINLTQRTK